MAYISKVVDVEVEVDVEDVIEELTDRERAELATKLMKGNGVPVPFGFGDGDVARMNHIVERAYSAARSLSDLPREIADLFWHVYGRAI